MACCKGSSSIAAILGVVGVVAIGIGGFNVMRTGCPLGSCESDVSAEPAITTVAGTNQTETSADACCSTGVEKSIEDCCGQCPEGAAKKAALTEASSTSEAKACDEAKSCGEKSECDGTAEQAALVEASNATATEAKSCDEAKSCGEKKSGCESEGATAETTAQTPAAEKPVPATAG